MDCCNLTFNRCKRCLDRYIYCLDCCSLSHQCLDCYIYCLDCCNLTFNCNDHDLDRRSHYIHCRKSAWWVGGVLYGCVATMPNLWLLVVDDNLLWDRCDFPFVIVAIQWCQLQIPLSIRCAPFILYRGKIHIRFDACTLSFCVRSWSCYTRHNDHCINNTPPHNHDDSELLLCHSCLRP